MSNLKVHTCLYTLMQAMPAEERSKILLSIADALEANEKLIIHENEADVADAHDDGYESSLLSRLALKPGKVRDTFNWSLLMYIIENFLLFPSNFLLQFCIFLLRIV